MLCQLFLVPIVLLSGFFQPPILDKVAWIISFQDRSGNQDIVVCFGLLIPTNSVILLEKIAIEVILVALLLMGGHVDVQVDDGLLVAGLERLLLDGRVPTGFIHIVFHSVSLSRLA